MDTASNIVSLCQAWGQELGFSQIGVAGVDLSAAEAGLSAWLTAGFHGSMGYMAHHGLKRARPAELVPGTVSVITARMDYLPRQVPNPSVATFQPSFGQPTFSQLANPQPTASAPQPLQPGIQLPAADSWRDTELARPQQPLQGTVSVYARGRDYHKVLRQRLQKLADRLAAHVGPLGHRVFTDSAPVLEAELATRSGQGWRGKHTLVLSRSSGSMFFLGEIYLDLALPPTAPTTDHCGACTACLQACPTQAIVAPYRLDARRCISYLTIEHDGAIPLEFRRAMGNRIYGCDDCQLACPWNKFAQRSPLPDFDERAGLNGQALAELLRWSEATFLRRTEGGPIRRIGHERWLRNVAVAAGNALRTPATGDMADADTAAGVTQLRAALHALAEHPSDVVREHAAWALATDSA
ncbi:MAG: tRNA epoxyqueuosine(34) reductase QueG [Burkholderiales bacterium]|nr:tRNA epoxyqueuosine(34) reductase QueG [Burkholderiales bacterium]